MPEFIIPINLELPYEDVISLLELVEKEIEIAQDSGEVEKKDIDLRNRLLTALGRPIPA